MKLIDRLANHAATAVSCGLLLAGCKSSAAAHADAAPAAVPSAPAAAGVSATDATINDAAAKVAEKQYPEAIAILDTLAKKGDLKAGSMLATLYAFGPAEQRRPREALTLAQAAAQAGSPDGERVLAELYLAGIGVSKDVPAAISWLTRSADQNDPFAEQQLGAFYALGNGVPKDPIASIKWTAKAAEQGNGQAIYNIAVGFGTGTNLPKDDRQAFFWYTVALPRLADNQTMANYAFKARDSVATRMTLDETRSLLLIAQTWLPVKGSLDGVRAQAGKATIGPMPRGTGSGMVLNGTGDILTARHVIHECRRLTVTVSGGAAVEAVLVKDDQAADLAVIHTAVPVGQPVKLDASIPVRQGETVITAGYPISTLLGSELNTTVGTISSTAGWHGNKEGVLFTAPVSPGNSGGPLLATDGTVVGVVEGQLNNLVLAASAGIIAENVNFATNIEATRRFLDNGKIAYERGAAGKELSAVEISDRARAFTPMVSCED